MYFRDTRLILLADLLVNIWVGTLTNSWQKLGQYLGQDSTDITKFETWSIVIIKFVLAKSLWPLADTR